MRPPSIVLFERIYIVCILLSLLSSLSYLLHPPVIPFPPNTPPAAIAMTRVIPIVSMVVGLGIALLFLYFIARRGSDIARWIFVVLFVLGVAGFARQFAAATPIVIPAMLRVIGLVHLAVEAVCVWLLFRPDAKPWFAARR